LQTPGCIIDQPEYQRGGTTQTRKNKLTVRMQMIIYSHPPMLSLNPPSISFPCSCLSLSLSVSLPHPSPIIAATSKQTTHIPPICYCVKEVPSSKLCQDASQIPLTHAREREREEEKSTRLPNGCLDGVFTCPLSSGSLVSGTVGLVDVCDFGDQWVVGIGVGEHGANGQQDF